MANATSAVVGFLVDAVLSDADDHFVVRRSDDGQDDNLPRVIDDDKILQTLVWHVLAFGQKPAVETPVGQRIEELFDQGFIADLDGSEEDLQPGFRRPVGFEAFRIFAPLSGDKGLVPVDDPPFFRLLDEPGAEFRVGDGNQRHRPLPDIFPVEIGDAVLGHHIPDVSPVQA